MSNAVSVQAIRNRIPGRKFFCILQRYKQIELSRLWLRTILLSINVLLTMTAWFDTIFFYYRFSKTNFYRRKRLFKLFGIMVPHYLLQNGSMHNATHIRHAVAVSLLGRIIRKMGRLKQ